MRSSCFGEQGQLPHLMNPLEAVLGKPPPDKTSPRVERLRWIRRAGYIRLAPLEILVLVLLGIYDNVYIASGLAAVWLLCVVDISLRIRRGDGSDPSDQTRMRGTSGCRLARDPTARLSVRSSRG